MRLNFRPRAVALCMLFAIAGCQENVEQTQQEQMANAPAPVDETATPPVPLLDGIGDHQFTISTDSQLAQRYFNQGLTLTYAFNHAEAIRAFREAARLDPTCGICYWGVALALGPNINMPMADAVVPEAWEAIQKAKALAPNESPREQAYIEALQARYASDTSTPRATLDRAYADAMAALAQRFPQDADALTLYADALMQLSPWAYWDSDGNPTEFTPKILAALDSAIALDPNHPGALHFYIHTVEASKNPARGEAAADRLGSLVPMAGHLVHMPSHIYVRVGRYHDAVEANARASIADENYIARYHPQGLYPAMYYPHNIHFLWFASMMEGQQELALDQARKLARKVPHDMAAQEPYIEWMLATPLFTLVRFGNWEGLLDEAEPVGDTPALSAMWHYARGMALAGLNRTDDATLELRELFKITTDPELRERYASFRGPDTMPHLLDIAREQLMSQIAEGGGDHAGRVEHLEKAAAIYDEIPYDEPPMWYFGMHQALGMALLRVNEPERAEAAFREDLEQYPNNGWSLYGLYLALSALDSPQAGRVRDEFEAAWSYSDVTPEDIPF